MNMTIAREIVIDASEKAKIATRFWKKVDVRSESDCWEWKASLNIKGYGKFRVNGEVRPAHRVVMALEGVYVPTEKLVCHTCDNRKCVNPSHLFIATPMENTRDCQKKGRFYHPCGEGQGNARLTEDMVRVIRRSPLEDAVLARKLGVGKSTVQAARVGTTWGHITDVAPVRRRA